MKVRVIAQGMLPDDLVTVVVDGTPRAVVQPWHRNNRAELLLAPGRHVLALGQVAENCRPNVDSLEITVPTGFEVELSLGCHGTPELEDLEYLLVREGTVWIGKGSALKEMVGGHSASWGPDGQRIAFADPSGIYLMEVGGIRPAAPIIPANQADLGDVAWSPRGDRIAYFWCGGGIFGDDCSHEVRLATQGPSGWRSQTLAGDLWTPAWSPDGSQLAVAGYEGIHIYDEAGRWLRSPTPGEAPGQTYGPAFSPDGRFLAYLLWPRNGQGQYARIRDLGTTHDVPVPTPWTDSVWGITWLPGGSGLVLVAYRRDLGQGCLFLTTTAGGTSRPLFPCTERFSSFRLRP
ncbi:MAG TPA: hypothetical protein VF862_15165 [Gemmatimonadales bacterium]